jgi:hypothetical protein
MKQVTKILWISIFSIGVGLIYFGIQKQIIIIRVPSRSAVQGLREGKVQQRRNVTVFCWFQGAFKQEPITVIDAENQADMLHYIVTNWLILLDQVALLNKRVTLESAMISSSHDAYISFDHSIFTKNESTHEKWMRIESLLKTIRAADMGINRVYIHVQHRPLLDAHLDFSRAWPVQGFLAN